MPPCRKGFELGIVGKTILNRDRSANIFLSTSFRFFDLIQKLSRCEDGNIPVSFQWIADVRQPFFCEAAMQPPPGHGSCEAVSSNSTP
jgi:hypothetical protein